LEPAGEASVGEVWPDKRDEAEDAMLVERDHNEGSSLAGVVEGVSLAVDEEADLDLIAAAAAAAALGT